AMVGATRAHNLIAGAFYVGLRAHLRTTACRTFMADLMLRIGDDFYYPDVLVACERADDGPYFTTHPTLIVEVLSPSTAVRDTRDKLFVYQTIPSLREYVIAEQDRRQVRVYRRLDAAWSSAIYAGTSSLELKSVDLVVPLDEIYGEALS